MTTRARRALLAGLAALVVLASAAAGGSASAGAHGGRPGPALARQGFTPAPQVVRGRDGNLFYGIEYDYYCALTGGAFDEGLARLGRLAHLIEKSGRTAVFTAAPNKSLVMQDEMPRSRLPQGSCDRREMRHETQVMDHYADPLFLPLRQVLAQDDRQVYYKTDHHWTSVGGSDFAQQLAERLSPRIAAYQHYQLGWEHFFGVLNAMLEIYVKEKAQTAEPDYGVRVRTDPTSNHWSGMPHITFDHAWNSRPLHKTWPGHTLVLGDSFGLHALEDLRPLFRHGRFMWVGHVEEADMAAAIAAADTVVIELYQTGITPSPLGHADFRCRVKAALQAADHPAEQPADQPADTGDSDVPATGCPPGRVSSS